uniref:Uncharacterized protein n=1 Tax=Panagrolaimus davidi TaxID=227884 RepID=A0A914R688_9BILA
MLRVQIHFLLQNIMDINEQAAASAIPNRRKTPVFVHGSSQRQYFAFPKFMMDYILKNPKSWKLWKKLIQSCKWFFDKNPIVVIPCLHFVNFHKINGSSTCSTQHCNYVPDRPIELINAPFKLWITELLEIVDGGGATAKYLIPRIYKCDAENMYLLNQLFTVDEFAFLTPKVLDPIFYATRIFDKNKKLVSFEKILESLPQIQAIDYYFNRDGLDVTPDTVKKIVEMEHVKKFYRTALQNISPNFDFDAFSNFMLENKQISFVLAFYEETITEEYRVKVKAFVEKLKTEDYGNHRRPEIYFGDINLVNDNNGGEDGIINP